MNFALATLVAGFPFVFTEIIARFVDLKPEVSRKTVHIGSAIAAVFLPLFVNLSQIVVIASLFTLFFATLRSRKLWRSLYGVSRATFGEISFPIGVALTAAIAPSTTIYITSMLLLGFMDPFAAWSGIHFGKKKMPFFKSKTIIGTTAALVSGCIITLSVGQFSAIDWKNALVLSFTAGFAELIATYGLDNITIPLAVSLVARLQS